MTCHTKRLEAFLLAQLAGLHATSKLQEQLNRQALLYKEILLILSLQDLKLSRTMSSYISRIASATTSEEEQQCLFVTLGMLVLDEIHFPTQDPIKDVIGGSGAYCKPQC